MKRSYFLASLVLAGLAAFVQADQGNPKLQSITAINFGPKGLLLIGSGSQVVTVETGDTKETTWGKTEVANIDKLLADKLGSTVKDIEIRRLAVNPISKKAYVAVHSLKSKQTVILTVDGEGRVGEFSLEDVKYNRYELPVADKVNKLTDLCWVANRIVAATQAGTTFHSRVFSINPGAKDGIVSFATETYHTGHGGWETKAPLICLMPYEEDGKTNVVGSFTCTPIVKYPLQEMTPEAKIKGVSVVELGTGNTPRSMFAYEKDKKKYILINVARNNKKAAFGTSGYWAARVDFDLLKESKNVNEKALWRIKSGTFQPATDRVAVAEDYFGVYQMDRLDDHRALVIREEKGGFALRALQLP